MATSHPHPPQATPSHQPIPASQPPLRAQETGRRFRDTVLALGGGVAPLEVFKAFRGREPSTTALLRHNDLLAPATA